MIQKLDEMLIRRWTLKAQEGLFVQSKFLRPLSGLWYLGATLKNGLYDRKLLPIHRLSVPVVSIGSITAGGTHKTPLVHLLAKTVQPFGSVAILSRGYKTQDEPKLLQQRLPNVAVYVGKDRVALGAQAVKNGAQVILLDDGFQYRRLYRDFELLTLAYEHPYGYNAFLPRGLLRDPPSRLKEADALFINSEKWNNAISVELKVRRLLNLQGDAVTLGKKVGMFCAIAKPKRFQQTLSRLGMEVVDSWVLPDHEKPDPKKLYAFAAHCHNQGAMALLCTEKDAVKFSFNDSFPLPIVYLEMELEVTANLISWQNLIEKIVLTMNNSRIHHDRTSKNYTS